MSNGSAKTYENYRNRLRAARLVVSGSRLDVVRPVGRELELALAQYNDPAPKAGDVDRGAALAAAVAAFLAGRSTETSALGGGKLHRSLHKAFSAAGDESARAASTALVWPTIEVPWRELGLLYRARETYGWDRLPLDPPPPVGVRIAETKGLREKQALLREPQYAHLRRGIEIEAGNDLTAYMLPLGADVTSPGSRTAEMFQTILWLGSLIGLIYKARFNAARPHVLDPGLEPFIPVPAFSSYPSNHAFQSYLIAEVFARAVPEHPGVPALFRAAGTVAENREWAGLHIPSDTAAGRRLARGAARCSRTS